MEPGEGIHSIRYKNIAMLDVAFTIMGAEWLAKRNGWKMAPTLTVLFLTGIVVHRALGIRTTVDKYLFPSTQS
jgi:hypothetical protein